MRDSLRRFFALHAMLLLICAGKWTGHGQDAASPTAQEKGTKPQEPAVTMLGPGVLRVGTVTLNKAERSIRFPAVLNASSGQMEYFLVNGKGKVHESILRTDAEPYHIHAAMLLLGVTVPTNGPAAGVPAEGPLKEPSKEALPGEQVSIAVEWGSEGRVVKRTAEELVYRDDLHEPLKKGSWVYNGSVTAGPRFLAQAEGSIISLITDPAALINNTSPGHDNDEIWSVNAKNLPPADLPVQVTITLRPKKQP